MIDTSKELDIATLMHQTESGVFHWKFMFGKEIGLSLINRGIRILKAYDEKRKQSYIQIIVDYFGQREKNRSLVIYENESHFGPVHKLYAAAHQSANQKIESPKELVF